MSNATASAGRERPILFSAAMVQALLRAEDPKTQTRRVVSPQPDQLGDGECRVKINGQWHSGPAAYLMGHALPTYAPAYGAPSDRLWVRETFGTLPGTPDDEGQWLYRADAPLAVPGWPARRGPVEDFVRWRPSIHMPRAASRITLELTEVRCERLQAISDADARAEGCPPREPGSLVSWKPRGWYQVVWDQINGARAGGAYAWARDPWVWALAFRRVEAAHA